ncbi:MAG: enoyl-CoA hydratase/isomerase family protein [Vampirovibrio sp.]|nr:enoyl-CoA hydratase/isomerase family protein [Vampirovibrio sp.]
MSDVAKADYKYIDMVQDGPIARFTLDRPEIHNAFNDEMILEIERAFKDVSDDDSVRAVILAANGKSFCAGADLNWMKKMVDYTFQENVEDAKSLADMLKAVRECRKPTIARVHGAAFGGGVGLITACDMSISLESCLFGLTEVRLGLLPAVISPFVLEKIGTVHANRYFLTAERFDAPEAKRIGVLSDICATEVEMDEWITKILKNILKNGPEAVSACKVLNMKVMGAYWEQAMGITTQMIAERRISAEGQEGMRSFLEKQDASWVESVEPVGK